MRTPPAPSTGDTLRALAAPGAVLALVVLVLNDHVLKQAWPGWVTGKLSDVAGLVVAPLLLAALLTLVRVPGAMRLALVATGAGFVFCKTSATGAAVTSSVWSLFGTPTMIRADVTDLIALPALYGAWRIHRAAVERRGRGWRRTVAVAVGTALLPVGVLATSATSCSEWFGYTEVAVLQGDFEGLPVGTEKRLAAYDGNGLSLTIDRDGAFLESAFEVAGTGAISRNDQTCAGRLCWRLVGDDTVETSSDAGDTWVPEVTMSRADRDEITDEVGTDEECGNPPQVGATDVAAMEVDGGVRVVVALQRGGLWEREADGAWTVHTTDELRTFVQEDRPPAPTVTELDAPEDPEVPADPEVPDATTEPSVEPPSPPCASPTPTTVTPNPSNGPPTTYDVCP